MPASRRRPGVLVREARRRAKGGDAPWDAGTEMALGLRLGGEKGRT